MILDEKNKKKQPLQLSKLPGAQHCGLRREVAEFKTFRTAYTKSPRRNITAICYKADAKNMNNGDLGKLWWSVPVQHNTYGLHYELHVAAVKCMTTGHK